MISFGSVCSGIEAASVAWNPLGWEADWFAEVDRAASEVLAHRFPEIPNLGDMTRLPAMVRSREIPAPDILVGGPPCQSFSIAGLRGGLSDPRGQLTLTFIDLANAIDEIRIADGKEPCIVVFENVPGLLSDKTGAFGCFLAGLAGESDALVPAGRKWTNAGCVFGPQRTAAWRVQDAQYHGLAQRRRRVFVVASARQGFDPAAVLLEFDGLRRDTAPSRETGEGFTHPTAPCLTSSGRGVERTGDTRGQDPVVAVSGVHGPVRDPTVLSGAHVDVVGSLDTERGFNKATLQTIYAGHVMPCIPNAAPVPTWWDGREVAQTLDAVLHKGQTMPEKNRFPAVLQPGEGFDVTAARAVDISPTLDRGAADGPRRNQCAIAITCFSSKDYGADAQNDLSPTLRAGGHTGSHANAGVPPAVVYGLTTEQTPKFNEDCALTLTRQSPTGGGQPQAVPQAVCVTGSVTHTLKAEGFDASEDGTGRGQPITVVHGTQDPCVSDIAFAQGRNNGGENALLHPPEMAVRRLMPVECERLQGFEDGWTLVPTGPKRKPAADGPRYKQLGNSMAVPVITWIGRRIEAELERRRGHNGGPPLDCDPFEDLFG